MTLSKEDIIKSLESMTLVELNELVKTIEVHFGVSAAVSAAPSENTESSKEPTEVNIVLTAIGQAKVAIIKLVGKLLGKGLMDSKKLIDKLPVVLKEKVKVEEAEEIKKGFINAGATVELK